MSLCLRGSHRPIALVAGVAALGFGLAASALTAPLSAQVVRGTVTERASNTPVSGVLLAVLDGRDTVVVQALSSEGGGFEIRLPGPGTYSLDVKRIGVKRVRLAPFTVTEGESRLLDISVEPVPAVLSSINITGRTSCVRNPQTNARTAALWEDARAALTAAVITQGLVGAADTVVRFERKLDVRDWHVLYETRRKVSASRDHPFRSLPAEVLSVGGYITVNQDGSTDYYAPDAEVLLSDTFLADHCFKIVPAGEYDHGGQIGLAFQPIPEKKKPDIKGVLWMDEKSAELRTLEFNYTWLPNGVRPADFGGTVSFFRMPGGRWIVRSWKIRMPEFGNQRTVQTADGSYVSVGRSSSPVVARISEEGGAVPLSTLMGQVGQVRGTVVMDTITNKPIAGITVALEGTGDSTTTGVDGGFELPFVQPGSYTIVIRHAVLDSLGIRHLARTVEVDAGQSAALALRFPTNQELAGRLCDKPVDFARHSVIRFLIVDQAGVPLANTPAVFSRVPIDSTGRPVADSATAWDVKLDAGGGFLGCALRGDEIVRIEAVPESGTPWGETVRPRVGLIGWHVVRVGKRR
jgi:Carboxypeptidase regulatory-like domain